MHYLILDDIRAAEFHAPMSFYPFGTGRKVWVIVWWIVLSEGAGFESLFPAARMPVPAIA